MKYRLQEKLFYAVLFDVITTFFEHQTAVWLSLVIIHYAYQYKTDHLHRNAGFDLKENTLYSETCL
jgi:hypothetical protein